MRTMQSRSGAMTRRTDIQRIIGVAACATALALSSTTASGAGPAGKKNGPAAACAAAYKDAEDSIEAGHLREAREALMACAKPVCGPVLLQQCTSKYTRLDLDIPSIVPVVNDESGTPRVDVQVSVDGEVIAAKLTGQAVPLNPGLHEFTFSADGTVFATRKVLVVEGQRNRPLVVSLGPAETAQCKTEKADKEPAKGDQENAKATTGTTLEQPPSDPPTSETKASHDADPPDAPAIERPQQSRSVAPYVLGAAGLAAVGAGALLVYWGKQDNDALGQCSPRCPQSSVDHVSTMYLAGDITAGAGVVALGAAAIWLIARPSASPQTGYRLDVHPSQSGATAAFSGTF